jgi:hypothetical protein
MMLIRLRVSPKHGLAREELAYLSQITRLDNFS